MGVDYKSDVESYGYGAKPHAATSAGGNTYVYDQNGNMTSRKEGAASYTQNFNIDNKLASVFGNNQVWKFVYDAEGNLVKKVDASGTTLYVGKHYEVLDATKRTGQVFVPSTQKSYGAYWKIEAVAPVVTKYYFFGGQRVAMRVSNGTPMYVHGDHLGSASLTMDNAGGVVSQARYAPFGAVRWQSGAMPTNYTFQSQRSEGFGLSDFNARYYDPVLGRFISADSVVANSSGAVASALTINLSGSLDSRVKKQSFATNPQGLNRYSFVFNSPLKFVDKNGNLPFLVITAAIGGLIGGGIALYSELSSGKTLDEVNWGTVGLGAGAGALAGLTLGAGTAFLTTGSVLASTGSVAAGLGFGIISAYGSLSVAETYGISSYGEMRDTLKGLGLQAHHIIEQRFAAILGVNPNSMAAVALTPAEHNTFTQLWRQLIPYATNNAPSLNTITATVDDIWTAAQKIYEKYPALLEAACKALGKC